jgi:hypothetical protein
MKNLLPRSTKDILIVLALTIISMIACNATKSDKPVVTQERFQTVCSFSSGGYGLLIIKDTKNNREYLVNYNGGIVELGIQR